MKRLSNLLVMAYLFVLIPFMMTLFYSQEDKNYYYELVPFLESSEKPKTL